MKSSIRVRTERSGSARCSYFYLYPPLGPLSPPHSATGRQREEMENLKGGAHGTGLEIFTSHSIQSLQSRLVNVFQLCPQKEKNGFGEKLGSLCHGEPEGRHGQ